MPSASATQIGFALVDRPGAGRRAVGVAVSVVFGAMFVTIFCICVILGLLNPRTWAIVTVGKTTYKITYKMAFPLTRCLAGSFDFSEGKNGAPGRSRTDDQLIKSQLL